MQGDARTCPECLQTPNVTPACKDVLAKLKTTLKMRLQEASK